MSDKRRWDEESDVVVVGYGGAGATAAITAHDNGARVIVLEKMAEGGGNTRVSAGIQLKLQGTGIVQYIEALCFGTTELNIIEAFVEEAVKNEDWVREIGGGTERHEQINVAYPSAANPTWPGIPGGELISKYNVKGSEEGWDKRSWFGEPLFKLLSTNVERRGIKVITNTPAKELITDENGGVVGVVAEGGGKRISIMAKRAVILACGGFEHNETMKKAFLPAAPVYAFGNLGNTGDGIVMAQKVGAALWHMPTMVCSLGFKTPEYEAAFPILMLSERFIYVDRDGKRFTNESGWEMHDMWGAVSFFDYRRACYPRLPAIAVFDDEARQRGPLGRKIGANRAYEWSLDNSKEIGRGWIAQGTTIRKLASEVSVDGATLESTVARYNQFSKAGKDTDFGRRKEDLGPIEKAPYYAIKLWPSMFNTQGGPRRDERARVLNHDGKPISRLYSAGELGSIWGKLYESAANVTECLAFGRIAGRNAAAQEEWR